MGKIAVIITCAWCGKKIGRTVWQSDKLMDALAGDNNETISHGICPGCQEKVIADAVAYKAKTLDSAIKSRKDMYI